MSLITKGEALRGRNHRIADANPEDTVAWEAGDNKIARRNLLCTAAGDHVAFSIWSLRSVLAPVMPASYLLAGGLFQERLRGCGADLVTPPLGTHRGLAHVIANRFRNAALVAGASRLDLCSLPGDPDNMAGNQEPSRGILDDVAKMLRLPFSTPEFIDRIFTGSVNQVGRRTLYVLITTWDAASGGPFAASAIASTGMAKTAEIVQSMFIGPVFNPLLKMLGADKVAIRASLCASQLVGLGIMRYGVRSEPMHSMTVEQLVDAIGPTMQRYLVGDISRG